MNGAGQQVWGWYPEGDRWVKLRVDLDGSFHVVGYVDKLEDIGDVLLTAIANNDILYWNEDDEEWQNIAHLGVADAHHARYADGEADARIAIHAAIEAAHHAAFIAADHTAIGNAAPHHAKYTDGEAVTAMGAKADANPLHHDKAEEWGAAEHTAIGDGAPHHAKYTNAEAKAAAVQAGAITNGVTKAPTHDAVYDVKQTADAALPAVDRYDDTEAVLAMGAKADANPLHHDRAAEWGAAEHTAIGDGAPHHAKYTDAEAVDAIKADAGLPLVSITFIIDGGGSAITTGQKGHLKIPFACTINRVTMMANESGSIVVDIWKDTWGNFPPTAADSITAATPPTRRSHPASQAVSVTGRCQLPPLRRPGKPQEKAALNTKTQLPLS
ncbi:hypothetical protein ES708_14010 [subsurface metagenome]